jgi:N-acetylmuramic acid 6-phosphate etherase
MARGGARLAPGRTIRNLAWTSDAGQQFPRIVRLPRRTVTLGALTERRNPKTAEIDLAGALEIVDLMNAEDRTVAGAVHAQREAIAAALSAAEEALRAGGRLFYAGAGTSGRLGVLDASEIPPTFGASPDLVQGIIAGGAAALTRSQEGAEDRPDGARDDLDAAGLRAGDFVIGIAASGTTPYVRAALEHAKRLGARTAILACSPPPADTLAAADIAIVVLTGPEVLTGSTRLKAGTATKLVLNTITTGAMIRLGKTYGNLMVDLQASNAKLRERAERIVREVCDVPAEEARGLLRAADGSVKLAIVMKKLDVDAAVARAALEKEGGVIRRVVKGPPPPVPPA